MSLLRKISTIEQIPRLVRGKVNYESIKEKSTFSFVQRAVSHQTNNRNHYLKAFFVIGSSYLTYKIAKGKLAIIPQVNAAVLYHKDAPDSLEGRKAKFNFIADVVETSASSVVYIEIKDSRRVDFFSGRPLTLSNGSGFIVESNGLIITNAHVVTNKLTAKVEVKLMDGRTFQGVVEDIDFKSDLATVRINATNLPVMKLGTSSDLRPGEFVVAIGSPLSLSNTVTSGVVSSAQRGSSELGLTGKDMVYIQTDAAITFGNSGGPLMNLDGEAIGVNSMKVTPGISFAIPIDYVKAFLKNARGPKKTSGPKKLYIGITMITLTPQLINELLQRGDTPLPNDLKGGVLVWKVILGSPAHNGGLQQGDIVTHIDGKAVKSGNDVYEVLSQVNKKELKVSVSRSGKSLNLIILPEDLN